MATITEESTVTKSRKLSFGPKMIGSKYGPGAMITAHVRYDDECGNGHNSFSITAEVVTPQSKRRGDIEAGGCLHEDVAKKFPKLAPFIKWHLCSTDGPMHYIANTVYLAGDKDYRGLRKDEKRQLRNGRTGQPVWQRVARNAAGKEVSVKEWRDADEKPQEVLSAEWEPVWIIGEGKERELDAARRSAIWPDATDEELTAPGLKERLEARLPGLLAEFRKAVESLGFTW